MKRVEHPFLCTCSRQPVLGMYGINEEGMLYFHKIVFRSGKPVDQTYSINDIKVWCKFCHRWWNVRINNLRHPGSSESSTPKPLTLKRVCE